MSSSACFYWASGEYIKVIRIEKVHHKIWFCIWGEKKNLTSQIEYVLDNLEFDLQWAPGKDILKQITGIETWNDPEMKLCWRNKTY